MPEVVVWVLPRSGMKSDSKDYRIPLTITLGLLMVCVAAIIVAGYIHGDMHFAKVLEHLKK